MGFFLEKAIFVNRVPFDRMELDFKDRGVNVLSAINGRGKTTILSYIVDAFHELARPHFQNSYEGRERTFYRLSSPIFSLKDSSPSLVYLRFRDQEGHIDYVDFRGADSSESFYSESVRLEDRIPFSLIKSKLKDDGLVKYVSAKGATKRIRDIFLSNLATYFPAYRYEEPGYLTNPYSVSNSFSMRSTFKGYLPNPLEVRTGLSHLSNWIMDVVLDWHNYRNLKDVQIGESKFVQADDTPERRIFNDLNNILSSALSSKNYGVLVRFGIGRRNNSSKRISIVLNNREVTEIAPNVNCLSSGELALLCVFGEILRQGDVLRTNVSPQTLSGIVLIDEVDKHLHIKLQKEVLPRLFKIFPNIQFIVSSHSPFLTMGLADVLSEFSQVIDLDNGGITSNPRSTEQYEEVYKMMISENNRFAGKYWELEKKIKEGTRPLIITEGKTDWKHFKRALEHFKEQGMFSMLDIEILEYDYDLGDSELWKQLVCFSKILNRYKIVGIFDCDEGNGKKVSQEPKGIKFLGNNVFAVSIPIPEFRSNNKLGISVEFLYSDPDLKKEDEEGRRIYVSSEFNENGRLCSNVNIGLLNADKNKKYCTTEHEKIVDHGVVTTDGKSLALSKEKFASNILDKKGNFRAVDFTEFKLLFEKIEWILKEERHG